jgi:hypothetical protein
MFVSSDGGLEPPEVPPGDINRFSFRRAGATGKWNPSMNPLQILKSGDSVNLYCHSVGVGPYGSILKPPAEASPVKYTGSRGHPETIFVPVQRTAFETPDRQLIQGYDNGTLSPGDQSAFEKMGLITSRELAPGPAERAETTKTRVINPSVQVRGVSVGGMSVQVSTSSSKGEYTLIGNKRVRIDYKKLQEKYNQLDLDWGHARQACFSSVLEQPFGGAGGILATFTIQFE